MGLCRFCGAQLTETFVDLGMSPLSNAFIKPSALQRMERFYPLHAYVCGTCFLVQLEEFESPETIFSDYAYFSSFSDSWLRHCETYAENIIRRMDLGPTSRVVEIASNDGYLLQYFRGRGIPVLGIEPAENVAKVAEEKGIPSRVKFFGARTAEELSDEGLLADLLVGNNVLAHVPDLNDFVRGMKIILKDFGVLTMEFPHLLNLIRLNQFDTIYHEHFSYLSFLTVERIFARHGLTLFDVEELSTHGGSLRIYGCHKENQAATVTERVDAMRRAEREMGLDRIETYRRFPIGVRAVKNGLLEFLIRARRDGKKVVGYGAAAKGNTLLNYCGIRNDFIEYVVDRSPHKQNLYLPGTHIPIYSPERVASDKPDYLLILPWNIRDEVISQMRHIYEWGGRFVVPIPQVEIIG
jgi:2-polyprenyl-3-methyl-5-hydroxy-6-metoxy-1,4-benzoquinol methylase